MRTLGLVATLVVLASACKAEVPRSAALVHLQPETLRPSSTETSGPFAGVWQSCGELDSPDQCSRYVLLQRGNRICGTWFYFASGDGYEGRVVAEATSPTQARRTRICGRSGSETRIECNSGWETIDKPLHLCDGKLGDLTGKDGECFADFENVQDADLMLAEVSAQTWTQACLAGTGQEGNP